MYTSADMARAVALSRSQNGEVVGRAAAGREHHLLGRTAQGGGHGAPGLHHGLLGLLARAVGRGRIGEGVAEVGQHDRQGFRMERRGGVVIEVDVHDPSPQTRRT